MNHNLKADEKKEPERNQDMFETNTNLTNLATSWTLAKPNDDPCFTSLVQSRACVESIMSSTWKYWTRRIAISWCVVHVANVTLQSRCVLSGLIWCIIVSTGCATQENEITPLSSDKVHNPRSEWPLFCFGLWCPCDGLNNLVWLFLCKQACSHVVPIAL